MSAKNRAASAGSAAAAARNNPYIQRLIEDQALRENIRGAYESAMQAYGRLNNGKPAGKALFEDKKLHKDLSDASVALRDAAVSLRAGPKKRKRHLGRKLLVLAVGAGLAIALSEGLRKTVLDGLFGKEEEFDYTPSTTPATPAPSNDAVTA